MSQLRSHQQYYTVLYTSLNCMNCVVHKSFSEVSMVSHLPHTPVHAAWSGSSCGYLISQCLLWVCLHCGLGAQPWLNGHPYRSFTFIVFNPYAWYSHAHPLSRAPFMIVTTLNAIMKVDINGSNPQTLKRVSGAITAVDYHYRYACVCTVWTQTNRSGFQLIILLFRLWTTLFHMSQIVRP